MKYLVSTHRSKPSDVQSDLLLREESGYAPVWSREGSIYLQYVMCDEAVICGGVNTLVPSHGHLPRTAEEALLPRARRGGRQMWVIRGGGEPSEGLERGSLAFGH